MFGTFADLLGFLLPCLILLPPHHPCVMDSSKFWVLGGIGFSPLSVHAVASSQLMCGQVHHWLCGSPIVIRSFLFLAWICLAIGIVGCDFLSID